MDNLGRLSGYIFECPGDLSLFRSKGPHDASWHIFLLSCFPVFLSLLPLPLRTNYLHPGLCLLKFGFWGTQTGPLPSVASTALPSKAFLHCHSGIWGFSAFDCAGLWLPAAQAGWVFGKLCWDELSLPSAPPVLDLFVPCSHPSPPISRRSVPLFHSWHLTGSLLMTGSGTFVQNNASLVFLRFHQILHEMELLKIMNHGSDVSLSMALRERPT